MLSQVGIFSVVPRTTLTLYEENLYNVKPFSTAYETMFYKTMLYKVLLYKHCANPWIRTTDFLNAVQIKLCTTLAFNVV